MDIGNHQIWQVAAGDTNRNYADLCLEWDVILNGPGSEGKGETGCQALKLDRGDYDLARTSLGTLFLGVHY